MCITFGTFIVTDMRETSLALLKVQQYTDEIDEIETSNSNEPIESDLLNVQLPSALQ